MISSEDIERVKGLMRSEEELDVRIGIGLALEKGMTMQELAQRCINDKWIKNLIPDGIPDTFMEMFESKLVDGVVQLLTKVYENLE